MCDYVDADGFKTKTYVKNGMLRSDFTGKAPEDEGSVLIRNATTYVWWVKDKYGFVGASADDNSEQKNHLISDVEKYKNTCKSADVSDTLFTVPTDIKFRDFFKEPTPTTAPPLP